MYIKDRNNQYINAEISISYENGENSIVVESRSGTPLRNPDYNILLNRILEIIREQEIKINAIYLASHRLIEIPREDRLIDIGEYSYPIQLTDVDIKEFRKSIQRCIARKESDSERGGNRQKKIQIVVDNQIVINEDNNGESEYIGRPDSIETEKDDIVKSRIGQGRFRSDVAQVCQGKCIITGATLDQILVASHIKPWKVCNNQERLDQYNGLFLAATYDKLFDRGLISFDENGRIMISPNIDRENLSVIGINSEFVLGNVGVYKKYLEYHREKIFIA